MKNTHDKLSDRLSIIQYCRVNFWDGISKPGDTIPSPISNGYNLTVWDHYWMEDGPDCLCGDIVDLCAAIKYDGDNGKAVQDLAHLTGLTCLWLPTSWQENVKSFGDGIVNYNSILSQKHRKFLNDYGINDMTIDRLFLGTISDIDTAGMLCIPHYKNGYFGYFTALDTADEKTYKAKKDEYIYPCLWGLNTLHYGDTLVLCSNPIQAVLAEQEREWTVLSTLSERCSKAELEQILCFARRYKRVVVLFDGSGARQIGHALLDAKINFYGYEMPDIISGNRLRNIVEDAGKGATILAASTPEDNIPELKTICRKASLQMSGYEMQGLIDGLSKSHKWDGDMIKSISKECSQCPSEDYVARAVLRAHRIAYNPKVGIMIYNGVYWDIVDDSVLHGLIAKELGPWQSGSKCKTITTLIKAHTSTTQLLNQKNIMNFINGALEINGDKVNFREHRPEDWCSSNLIYPYIPDKYSPEWDRFVYEIMDRDSRKIALLQEAAGFPLFKDNKSMQTAFFLQGDGGNGKSLFMDVLKKVYGDNCVSHIKMENLNKDFQRIQLSTSRFNVCDESNNGDAQLSLDDFKLLVGGTTTNACYKGKDFINFECKSKFFVLCNTFPRVKDVSKGFIRRCKVIKFTLSFIDEGEPRYAWERKADTKLFDKLERPEVLPAIFNWVLLGYLNTVRRGCFTTTSESLEAKKEIKELTNPLAVFVHEIPAETEKMSNQDMYQSYRTWCDMNGCTPMSKKSLDNLLPPIMRSERHDLEKYHIGPERGWRKVKELEK